MTIEEANKLIEGEVYVIKYNGNMYKRIFKRIFHTKTNAALLFARTDINYTEDIFLNNQIELIGKYDSELKNSLIEVLDEHKGDGYMKPLYGSIMMFNPISGSSLFEE